MESWSTENGGNAGGFMMEVLTDIPAALEAQSVMKQARIEPGADDAREFEALLGVATETARPKAMYRVSFVEAREADRVQIDGVAFRSRVLRKNLETVERVFPFVVTCGHEIDEAHPAEGDMLKDFWWDVIKACLLGVARKHLKGHLDRKFRLGKTSSMGPGSGDVTVWPIEQQKELFTLVGDVQAHIGVRLTDSFLMVPNKTVSGIRFPAEKSFRSCQVCHRKNCPSRAAPFEEELWGSMQRE